jgi:hypothetical protein
MASFLATKIQRCILAVVFDSGLVIGYGCIGLIIEVSREVCFVIGN